MFEVYITHEGRNDGTHIFRGEDATEIMALVGTYMSYRMEELDDKFISIQIIRKEESNG